MRELALLLGLVSCTTHAPTPQVPGAEQPRTEVSSAEAQSAEVRGADPHAEVLALLEGDAREAFMRLADSDTFTSSHVGVGGLLSRDVAALRLLVRHPNAQVAIDALWRGENRVARLYALAGFWYLRPGEYRAALESLRGDETRVDAQSGCMLSESTVARQLGARSDETLVPGSDAYDVSCTSTIAAPAWTMENGRRPIELIEGSLSPAVCRRPREEWTRLTLQAARPDAETACLLEEQREQAVRVWDEPIDDASDAEEMLLRSAGVEP